MIIIKKIPEEYVQMVSNCMLMALDDYEITPRCTEIAVPDTSNTFASRLAKAGMPPQEIQILLGHSSLTTTMIYVTTEEDMIRNSYMRYVS